MLAIYKLEERLVGPSHRPVGQYRQVAGIPNDLVRRGLGHLPTSPDEGSLYLFPGQRPPPLTQQRLLYQSPSAPAAAKRRGRSPDKEPYVEG